MTGEEMVERFLCPGCVCGGDTKCGKFARGKGYDNSGYYDCEGHVLGTIMMGVGGLALGMPKGFCRPPQVKGMSHTNQMHIYLAPKGCPMPDLNHLNVPVWGLEKEGCLFLYVVSPRVNYTRTFVLEGRTFEDLPPGVVNVGEFYGSID